MRRITVFLFFAFLTAGCSSPLFFFIDGTPSEKEADIKASAALSVAVEKEVKGEWDQAYTWIKKALERDPTSVVILRHAGRIQLERGKFDSAIDYLSQASQEAGERSLLHLDIAKTYKEGGLFARAMDEYLLALKYNSQLTAAGRQILEILVFFQNPQSSLPFLRELTTLLPPSPLRKKVRLILARNYRLTGKYKKGRKILETLEEEKAFPRQVLLEKIFLLGSLGEHNQALKLARKSLEKYPRDIYFFYAMGQLFEKSKERDKAALAFKEVLSLLHSKQRTSPSLTASQKFTLMGELYLKLEKEDYSLQALLRAIKLDPNNRNALLLLAETLEKEDQAKLATRILESYLRRFPFDREVKGKLAYIYSQGGTNLDRAIRYATQGLELFPTNEKFLYALGWAHFQKFEFQRAISALRKATRHGVSPKVRQALGYIYFCLGDVENSKKWYLRARELSSNQATEIREKLSQIQKLQVSFR